VRPAVRVLLLVPAVAAGAVAAVLGSFVHPYERLGLPVGLVVALTLSAGVFGMAGLLVGRRGAAAAALGWVLPVLLLSSRRPEGDLVVPATTAGYVWLLGGTLLAVAGVAVPYPRPGRRTGEPSALPADRR
jgi:uncharacterized protein DUF6113